MAEGAPLDDLAELTPEEASALESDPRIAAAALRPENVQDILAEQSRSDRGADGRGRAPYGDAGLLGGPVKVPSTANPLTGQRAGSPAAGPHASDHAPGNDDTSPGGVKKAVADAAKSAARNAAKNAAEEVAGRYGLSMPEGDSTGEKIAHGAGQGANFALGRYLDRYAPGVFDRVMSNRLGRWLVMRRLKGSAAGRFVPESFWKGFQAKYTKGDNKKEKASGTGSDKENQHGKLKVLLGVGLPVLVPFLCIVLIAAMILGVDVDDDPESQPEAASDEKVAAYFPGGWQQILKQASEQTSGSAQDYSEVPWTILAGLAKAQTDFARYSPYDNIDRDPGREAKEVPGGDGSADGGTNTNVSNTVGAGPGPVQGVTGAGSAATVPGTDDDHVAPPDGDLSHQLGWFLWALRMQESGGDYTKNAGTKKSSACGAYQYITSTWNNYAGYRRACQAPPSVQDRRAKRDVLTNWNRFHKWQQVAVEHFTGSWGDSPEKWHQCPGACDFNPTAWKYADGVMSKMRAAARDHPAGAGPGGVQPASFLVAPGGPGVQDAAFRAGAGSSETAATGLHAGGCDVADPDPDIGGKDDQGSGPYLLTPAASGQMRMHGLDPQNPCQSSYFVAFELVKAAEKVHRDPKSPRWKADGDGKDQAGARRYWSKVIETSGIFMDRSPDPGAPCAVPPPDDPSRPWPVSFKIISIWRCEATRLQDLYLVSGGSYDQKGVFGYTVETDRATATGILVNEALSVSYGAGHWKTDECDNSKDDRQGVFPMTKKEAEEAHIENRCDVDGDIAGAADLVLSVEKVPPKERPHDLGVFQPMVGGWQKISIAMSNDLGLFSRVGPAQEDYTASEACTTVMRRFLTAMAPHSAAFATLQDPPDAPSLHTTWEPKLQALETTYGIPDPIDDKACVVGSWSAGYSATLSRIATDLSGGVDAANLKGLANFYQAREEANRRADPVSGRDGLVIPRLAPRPLKEISVPVGSQDSDAWSRLGTSESVALPLQKVAVDYAWFFGGVIPPFDSAGKSLSGTPLSPSTPVYQGGDGSAARVISVATSLIGTGDRGGRDNNLNQYNQYNGEPWCADFVSWVIDKAGATKAYWNSPTGTPAHRWAGVWQWRAAGRALPVSEARPGDLAIYGDNAHINIVVRNLGQGRLSTIGGNQGPLVESGVRTTATAVLRPNFNIS
ncbi:CHAP domain-containing protein [Actinomadura sp. NPDC000929]|uniref:CHAP domain-containing protein n=1 Tax=Actinomadura sp. NPDC000929 TaxID=3154517 RepID=UPI0033917986